MKKALVLMLLLPSLMWLGMLAPIVHGPTTMILDWARYGSLITAAPVSSWWDDLTTGTRYHLSSWVDNGDGHLSGSDEIDLTDPAETVSWWHIDWYDDPGMRMQVTSLIVYPEFPLGMVMEIGLLVAVAYFGFKKVAIKPQR